MDQRARNVEHLMRGANSLLQCLAVESAAADVARRKAQMDGQIVGQTVGQPVCVHVYLCSAYRSDVHCTHRALRTATSLVVFSACARDSRIHCMSSSTTMLRPSLSWYISDNANTYNASVTMCRVQVPGLGQLVGNLVQALDAFGT
jgi:hypothetical protein